MDRLIHDLYVAASVALVVALSIGIGTGGVA